MRAYGMEFREAVLRAVDGGKLTRREIALLFGVNDRWLRKLIQRRRETGSAAPKPHAGGPAPKIGPAGRERIRRFVAEHPDATLAEIAAGCDLPVSQQAICHALQKLGLRRKKKVLHASERDRPDVQAEREDWRRTQGELDPQRLVFVDETAVHTGMTRTHGRAARGERVTGAVPENHGRSTTLTGSLRRNGEMTALVYDGGTDVSAMLTFIEQQLAPTLRPGDVVVWDNLATHQSPEVVHAIERTGARVLPLPAYSPDFNPIENLWSKAKTYLRAAAARTRDALIDALGRALNHITPADAEHWFDHAGYRPVPT